ncbi:hypothetical protein [Amycolatopsis taiwanensis]|uniref:Uncharacterized protein n=1 Tax=Amycolatopsis taiwanensis TaxID=342230 RepID=A0A9W6VLL3_9PSEU|nr:hypothetical protein [Amycolatopsis taiwanensis]GLY71587.1 hypothetical protein Atai01_82060 [Amycolatopsis taiwanensis]
MSRTWAVKTEEQHLRRVLPGLVEVHPIAGPRQPQALFDRMDKFTGPRLPGPVTQREKDALDERTERAVASNELVDAFNVYTLQTMLADQAQLPEIAEHVYDELRSFRLQGDPAEQAFPHASVHVVWRREELVRRIKMAGLLVRVEHDAQLAAGDLKGVQDAHAADDLVFSSSESLLRGAMFLDAYFGPLLGALSPAIWGFHTAREIGLVVYSLGRPIAGTKGEAAELLQLLPTTGPCESVRNPHVEPRSCSEAIEWWATRLDRLFGVLTNPAVFTDQEDHYVPIKHIQAVSSAEQLFRRITSLQGAHRDEVAQRVLFFSSLDMLERLVGRDIESYCTLRVAEATLQHLRTEIPSAAAQLLLPPAERAVTALRELQDGFYLARQLGKSEIEVLDHGTVVAQMSLDKAAAAYVKMLRNATHGFGTRKAGQVAYANSLLAHHNGVLPHDLVLLAYLYLLDVLTKPDVLARRLYRQGRVD